MKSTNILMFSLSFVLLLSTLSFAQEASKKTTARYKDKLKKMEVSEFMKIMQEYEKLPQENETLRYQARALSKAITDKDAEIEALAKEKETVGAKSSAAKKSGSSSTSTKSNKTDTYVNGVVFRVQIGAYKSKNFGGLDASQTRFLEEAGSNGEINKFTIGTFRDYWEADLFKKYLKAMGVQGPWIVAYKDNARVNIKDVLSPEEVKAVQKSIEEEGGGSHSSSGDSGGDW